MWKLEDFIRPTWQAPDGGEEPAAVMTTDEIRARARAAGLED